jgi:hypothetical protein
MYESDQPYAKANSALMTGARYNGAGTLGQEAMSAKTVQEKPRIHSQLDVLAKILAECGHITAVIDDATNRILGPQPEPGGVDKSARPVPNTVEQKLQETIEYAQNLANRLSNVSAKLNAAV